MASSDLNTSSNKDAVPPRSPTPVEQVCAPHSRIPLRSTSLPSLKHRFRRSISLQSPRKSVATIGDAPSLEHATLPKYSHSKSLSDYIPHLPKMTLNLGSGLFPSRSKIPDLRRRHTGSVFYEDDGLEESDSEEERYDQPSHYPMPVLSPEEFDVHISQTSLWEEIQFPDFDDDTSRVEAFSIMPDTKTTAAPSVMDEQQAVKSQAVLPVATAEDDSEWMDLEKEDVNWMRELLLGNITI